MSVDNTMRHTYRTLTADEKEQMQALKDAGLALYELLDSLDGGREITLAKAKVEEAVMWGVKAITQ